jgi:hypothetical protein
MMWWAIVVVCVARAIFDYHGLSLASKIAFLM